MYKYLLLFSTVFIMGAQQEDAAVAFDPVKELARIQFERFMAPFDGWIEVSGPLAQMRPDITKYEYRKETIWYCMVLSTTEAEDYKIRARFGLNANERKKVTIKVGEPESGGYEYDQEEDIMDYIKRIRNETMKALMEQVFKDIKKPECQDLLKNGKGTLYYLPSEQTDPKDIKKHWKIY